MEKPNLEVVIVSSEDAAFQSKRVLPAHEDQPVYKRRRTASPSYPMEWEASIQPHRDFVASSLACPPVQPPAIRPQKKLPCRVPYDPNDFTSDALDPAFEWPREPPPAKKYGAEVALLQSILGQFPLGLRMDKLATMMWKVHKVHLWKLSMEQGYRNIQRFLEEVPGVRLSVAKGGSRYLVQKV